MPVMTAPSGSSYFHPECRGRFMSTRRAADRTPAADSGPARRDYRVRPRDRLKGQERSLLPSAGRPPRRKSLTPGLGYHPNPPDALGASPRQPPLRRRAPVARIVRPDGAVWSASTGCRSTKPSPTCENHYSPPRGSFVTHALNRTDVLEVNVETPAGMVGTATLQPPRAPDGGVPVRPYADLPKNTIFRFYKSN